MKMNRDRKFRRRVATVVVAALFLVPVGASPASAYGQAPTHGYCGHKTSVNWITGWSQVFVWEAGNGMHLVAHYNNDAGIGPLDDLHRCH